MTNLYTNDHARITGYLRNYDPIKQNFRLLPYNATLRPLIVPQDFHFGLIESNRASTFVIEAIRVS